jgi:hypothetical protein
VPPAIISGQVVADLIEKEVGNNRTHKTRSPNIAANPA